MNLTKETRISTIANVIEIGKQAILSTNPESFELPTERAKERAVALGVVVAEDFAAILATEMNKEKITEGL